MLLCASLQLRQVFRCPFDWAKADVPGTSRVHSVDRPFRPAQRSGQPFFRTSRSGIPLSATALTSERDKPRQPIPASVLRTGHRTRCPQTEADRAAARRPSAHRNNCHILPPSGIACRVSSASAPAKRNETHRNAPVRRIVGHPPDRGKRTKRIPHGDTDYRPHSAQTSRPPRKTRRIRGVE